MAMFVNLDHIGDTCARVCMWPLNIQTEQSAYFVITLHTGEVMPGYGDSGVTESLHERCGQNAFTQSI